MKTTRECIKDVINHKKPEKHPWIEQFTDDVLLGWAQQGLPIEKLTKISWKTTDVLVNYAAATGFDPYSIFECNGLFQNVIPIDLAPLPRFKQRIIDATEDYTDYVLGTGAVIRRSKKANQPWYNMPHFIKFPVSNQTSWKEYQKLLNPHDPQRYPKDWHQDHYLIHFQSYQDSHTIMPITGFYGFGAELMGILNFVTSFYQNPELIYEMLDHWEYFTLEAIRNAVETLQGNIDMIYWWEDMAERHGPCISPRLFQDFLLPRYQRVTAFLTKNHISRILVDSDGNINPLLDLFHKAGFTGLWPLEVNAGMNAIEIKKKFGKKFFLIGNLDKRTIVTGGDKIREEINDKIPFLLDQGGYIPGADHVIPANCSYQNFLNYQTEILRALERS